MCANWLQSCPTLCDPMDYVACQAPLSMEILQGRMLRWVAMPSSRRSSWPRGSTLYSLCNVLIFLCLWKFSLLSTLLYLILTYAFILLFSKYPCDYWVSWAFLVPQRVRNPLALRRPGFNQIPELGRSPGGGHGNLYSCLENSMNRGTWWATVHGVTKSQAQLSN